MFSDLVRQARSFRRFDASQPIPAATVRQLVDVARLVPSGANAQPLRYRIITEPAECEKVFPQTSWAGALPDWAGPAPRERPTAYIAVCSDAGKGAAGIDIGIACQTIQLAATSLGFGACMLGAIQHDAIREALGINPQWAVRLLVALGKPAETVVLEEIDQDGETRYWRSEDDVHHVPKRSLESILL